MKSQELSDVQNMLQEQGYISDGAIAMSIFLAMRLEKPLLIEGPAGVGKTEVAKVMAKALETVPANLAKPCAEDACTYGSTIRILKRNWPS